MSEVKEEVPGEQEVIHVPSAEEGTFHCGSADACVQEKFELLPPQQLSSASLPHFCQSSWEDTWLFEKTYVITQLQ